jgi:serine/threonine protein kinase/tetratricopeptide (TPR) repeat protein
MVLVMSIDRRTAKDVFVELVSNVPPEEWENWLEQSCQGDDELRDQVRVLLRAHAEPGSFLEQPAVAANATVLHEAPISELPGTAIGPYKLLQQIGEGGMGVVFMADQERPIQRTVALKIIKPGMDTRQVIARFEAERQALAMMDHPSIAKVLDAGTTETGRPYFVMELVKGVPITSYCDEKQLCLRERLSLFKTVCEAVQHAHQKGIIHRDLKPTNVLVAEYDNLAVPKVIDFGVAKATAQKLTERTMFTEFGQVIGTVEYMSPEQAKLNQLDIDTRSDIYSLGVLLYELLTGTTPFERERLRSAAFDEVLRIIREEEPPKPSTKLSSSDTLPSIAANRHTEPSQLSKDIRGELDWIVMKALEKDRGRRYETASGLASDVERYLRDDPVEACPPSAAYRFRKFASRNRRMLATGAIVAAALVTGTVVSTWQAVRATRATRAEHSMREQATKSEAIAVKNARIAQQRGSRANKYFLNARATFDAMAERLKDPALLRFPEVANLRKQLLTDLLQCYQNIVRDDAEDVRAVQEKAGALRMVGDIERMLGERVRAEKAYRDAIALREPYVAEHPDAWESYQVLATCYANLGNLLAEDSRPDEAEVAFRRALALWFPLTVDHSYYNSIYGSSFRTFHKVLFKLLEDRGQGDAARAVCGQLLAPFEQAGAGSPQEAEPQLRLADALYWASFLLEDTGRTAEGVKLRDRALTLYEKLAAARPSPADRPRFGYRYHRKALLLIEHKRKAEAVAAFQKALELNPTPEVLDHVNREAYILRRDGDLEQARELRARIVECAIKSLPAEDARRAKYQNDYFQLLLAMQRYEEAETAALDALKSLPSKETTSRVMMLRSLANLYKQWNKPQEADRYNVLVHSAEAEKRASTTLLDAAQPQSPPDPSLTED